MCSPEQSPGAPGREQDECQQSLYCILAHTDAASNNGHGCPIKQLGWQLAMAKMIEHPDFVPDVE